ncbi:triose-phosphate isomerase [Consotaella salsifontis]|uniref:Triosephosphate isomerase n=1 Tax=Consotaella salsifontis TaxID=1365950 RepID=A0A1T4TG06_9HYPH|nr:triose-phosphate isomerase [Consotaella salsifontis]SKA39372.1 triosephosphate isomerase [Consotaella salsifontis]
MLDIFVNLKRFEVSRALGGVCGEGSPKVWIENVIGQIAACGLGKNADTPLTLFLPEALVIPAVDALSRVPAEERRSLAIGCQGVHREDIRKGGNFGAFSSSRPATAMKAIGCTAAMIGHSEERREKAGVIAAHLGGQTDAAAISETVSRLINQEALRALETGLDVLICVGETAEERSTGTPEEQMRRVEVTLGRQMETSLAGTAAFLGERRLVIGYEPIWAIGPGKTPPAPEAIEQVTAFVKKASKAMFGQELPVVYGGGLKEENARAIAALPSIDGGLVALTRFTGEIGFYPEELATIIDQARAGAGC